MNLKEMFQHAIKNDKNPMVLLPIEADCYVRVTVAQKIHTHPEFRNFLYLNLQQGTAFDPKASYLGAILNREDNVFRPADTLKLPEHKQLRDKVIELIKNPHDVLQKAGRKHSFCCFCGTQITSKDSLAVGYGPICAEKFGLPWGV